MFLAVDVGNSNITLGVYNGDEIVFLSRMSTDKSKTPDEIAIELKQIFELHNTDINFCDSSAISSVVPELSSSVKSAVKTVTGCEPMLLGPGIKTGMNILIDNPAQLGADLLAGCIGAKALYKLPCIVVDLGTATKISVIDKNGAFRGCSIAPGVRISIDALSEKTSQLPNISLKTPRKSIGTNTLDSMQSGTVFGFAAMVDGLCDREEKELGQGECTIVATGGLAKDLVKSCSREMIYNKELILYGLKTLYELNDKDRKGNKK